MAEIGTMRVKSGLAEMLKGGVIMDVTTAEQARIAEDAGANVEPNVCGSCQSQQCVERLVVRASRIHAESAGHRRVEIGRIGDLARALDLLFVSRNSPSPGLQNVIDSGSQ
jgi:hypothetical protein